jgi:tripartite-type tricarboxylate transporter receptor subunit TctC
MTSLKRSPLAPEIPTVSESGIPGYQANIWNGVLVPTATPKALVTRLNAEFVRVLSTPETRERFAAMGADAAHSTPEEFRDFILAEENKWARVVRESGIRVELER